ncbi:cytochrome P450 [Mycobacterium sp. ACS4331]|uniref:cytochrome P450 n=1 Tax=Mycobacterium sp. ACS4331 TaxID=1834121 RepID=UPI000800C9C9|nr:cytochrome P450 [Mycobacterium sp. ACS4331]OBF25213.1 cytochrome [Mycobacterium sp. ACS4331]
MSTAVIPDLAYDHLDDPEAAHRAIRAARERGPLAMGPHGVEVLSHDLVRAVLRDDRFVVPKGFALAPQGVTSGPLWDRAVTSLLCLDGAEHRRLRRLVAQAFTPKSAARMRTACIDVISGLLDQHPGACDMVSDIARPYPVPIICALLGAPRQDWHRFSDWAEDVLRLFSWDAAANADAILSAWTALDAHVDTMIAERRQRLTDDLLSDLIRCEDAGDRLSHGELLMLAGGLLMAGTDTTRNQLAAAIEDLCDHPDQWRLLRENPELAPLAVEELIRHRPIVFAALRVTTEDVELAGHRIPAGTTVVANTASANRDPAVHDDPDRLDITREGVPPILTFGSGVHYCLGVHLAKLELAEALAAITARIAEPRLTARHPWRPLSGISGPTSLPVEFAHAEAA